MAKLSRTERWNTACNKIRDGMDDINSLREEYEEWYDGMPENLQSGPTGEKLQVIIDCSATDEIENAVDELENLELPQGFGRD